MQRLYKALFLIIVCSVFAVNAAFSQCTLTGLNSSYCVDDASVTLSGGTAYYGPGVSGGVFYPSIAGVSTRPHKVFTTDGVATSYTVSTTGTYYPYTLSSSALSIANSSFTTVSLGFNFVYFGTTFSTVGIFDNGFIKFGGGSTSSTAQLIPNATIPNSEVAFAWNDLDPSTGTIRYQVFGSAPLRVFVVEYANVQFMGGGDYVTVQVHLFETSNHIEIHSTHNGSIGANKTMGIENSGGTIGVAVPGRNQSVWTADNDFVSFTPSCTVVKEVNVHALPNAALTVSPASTSICPSNTVGVTIGSSELGVNYQLLNNADNSALSGTFAGTGGNLVITSSALASSTVIKVRATNATTGCDVDLTNLSNITVNVPPQITVQPTATQTICVGQSVTFSVNAGVTTSPTYQWKKGGVDIVGATSSSYTIASVATTDAATYTVSVGGTCTPPVLSSNAVLNVNTLPAITTQPSATQTVCEDSAASFTVVATGTSPTYQWKKNGVDIVGATSATYNIATTATADAGTYTVVVSGACSPSVISTAAVLNINEKPEITVQPTATQTICVGQSVTFSVNAGVTTSPTYQWKKGGVDIVGATSSSYTIASVTTGDAATYTVSVGGTCTPAILSSNAVLNVNTLPAITTQPSATQTVCEGSAAGFTVVATGTSPTYQWKKNGVDIVGATSATYNIATTATADAGTYTVIVSGTCSPSVTSTAAVLNINEQPEIITQPTATQTVCVGQSVTFSVNAGVTTSPTYQWKKGGVDIVGATSSSYTIASVATGDAATYTVSVGGTCTPAILSSNAVLNVNTLPAITTQPSATQTVCEGSAVSFTVVATGTSLTYQWKKNGVDIAGATSATYNIATTATADAGTYTVVVSGTCSPSVTSTASVLNINEKPEITVQPTATQTVCVGQSVTFSVNAGVTTSPTYQWKKGGVDIVGATSSSYTIASVATGDAATYTVSVGGTCTPAILSSNAVLNVNTLPAITTQPSATQTVCEGSAVSFTVVATGTSLTYQWKKNGVDIAGATSATYNIATTATADAGTYTVVVSGTCSPSVTSNAAVLNINEQPEIITQPTATQTVCVGQSVTFSVNAGVTTSPTYQWKKGGVNIPGANSSSYTIASVATTDAATYTVSVGGTCTPAILSSNAVLNVNTLPSITTQPSATQTVCEGSAASFTVVASGTGVTYQWKKNGVDIAGATSATYNIATTATADAGTYTVVVSGTCSPSVTSNAAVLNINEQPEIITQPTATQTVCVGQSVTFSVNAGVTTSPTYQWKKGGVDIVGATSSNYTIASVTTGDAATYTVSVGGTCTPAVLSSNAVLNVNTLPSITTQPSATQTVCEGSAASFTVVATGTSLTYQWKKNGVDIAGATSATYNIATTATADAGTYTVVVSGTCSPSVTSIAAVLNINEQPEIITQPTATQTVCVGQSITFSVNAGVTTTPTYQWKKGGVDIVGATSSSYTIASVVTGDAATYTVSVGGTCTPAILSSNAVLNVNTLPAITTQPSAAQTVCEGNAVSFTVAATGTSLTYQWKKNGVDIAGATSATYNIASTVTADAGTYTVVVSGTCSPSVTSTAAVLNINEKPEITVQPTATQTICVGQSVTFSVNAGVTTSPTYQWKKGGVDIVGATSSTYTIASVTTGDAATYTVSVGGTCTPAVLSSNAVLNVNTLPSITTQPSATQTVCEGSAASFTVVATGTSPTYQWKKNGVDIAGATSATYNIATTATADAGTYTVVVSGTCSPSVTSNAAVLNINEQPEIITQPTATQTVCVGQSVTFSVNAGVTTSPTYQWKKGGVNIPGANSSSYTIASVTTGDAATYTVSVGGTCTPAILSSNAVLNVNTLPAITTQPSATQTVCEGSAASFTVVASGTGVTYQWKKNGVDIVGATSATYNIATTATADAGTYTVVVNGTCSPSVTSTAAVLNINEQPEIITQPTATQTVCVGQSVTFSVNAGVTTSPTYQWKKGGVDIVGATSSSYTIASVATTDAATYTVSVGGTCTPAILSSNAVLNVNTLPAITTQPSATQTVCEGSAASFTVAATGTSLTYQWKKNGVDIAGATSATYNIATTVTADAGTYTVVVSGTCSPSVTSTAAVLNINEQPEIITQPAPTQTVCVGQSVTFSVNAGVTTSPTYQWKKGGVDIVGATSSSYTIASVVTGDAATYTVLVGGTCTPAILSSNAVLNVNTLPSITTQPSATQTVCEGSAASFTVVATGTSLTYQWKKNGVDIVGATSATYNIATTVTADAGTYTVVVSGICSPSITSTASVLNINEQPEIITQPAPTQTVCVGQSVTFSVNPGVTTSPTYQWKKGGVDIVGATSSSYTIASVTTGDAATYTVSVGGTCTPAILSSNAVLNVNTLPSITTQPSATQTVCEGSAASFTVVATGTSPTYQWKKNGVDIAGATSATYNIAATVTSDAGTYTVVVSGTCSPSVTSNAAVLNINEQPEIITQPTATQTVCVGQSVTFSVNAGVTTSPTYQWKKGGVNIPGANSSTYTIASVVTGDAATYTVSVGGTCTPAVLSSNAVLNVNTLPVITTQPSATQTVCEGSAVNFTVVATGTSLTYQWKKNGVDIAGATSATYNIATTATADAGTYTVVVSGTCSPSVTSNAAVLNINEQPEIITQPTATQTVCVGQSVTFSVNAGVTTSPTYQWKKGGVDIVGATSSSYTIASVATGDAATYTVSVGGTCTPAILSSNAVLNVNTLPSITTQPLATQTVCEGSAASFTVVATGTSLTYQWKKNGVDISGATSATYNIGTTVTADAGTYTVVVSGTCSPSVTSNAAVLNINEKPEIITQPTATQTVCVGQSVTFSVNAGVTTSPTYQWKKGGVDIVGATSSSYTIASVATGDAATYTVSVGGTCTPAILSSNAVLNVNTLPAITTQPSATQTVCEGSAASFTVVASGTGVTYQWKKNGVDIVGATSATYNIATTATADAGTYTVVVSGTCSPSVTSTAAVLNINEQPEIITQPTATQTICVGQSVTFSVNAGVTTSPTYQWKKGGVDIVGATSSSYTIASVTTADAATYTVSVGGTCTPPVLSSNAVLNVNTLPAITIQPSATQTVCEGSAVSFTVVATGTSLTYQWKKNGVDIAGATSATYNIVTTATADAGTYTAVVSGTCSPSVTSTAAVLNINEKPEITVQPTATQTVCVGQSVTFSVNAGVTTSPTYQWKKGGVDIVGATSSSYTIASVTTGDAATYTVSVGGTCTPAILSSNAVLNVNVPPTSFASPQTICSGQTTNVTITNPNSVSGTVFNWTIQTSNNVTGALPGSATVIAQPLSSTDGVNQGTVTYQIIGTAAGCSGPPFAVTVTVNPIPNASASNNLICSGSSANIALLNPNGVANTSFSWTVSSSSNVTGAGNGSGTLINQILTSTDGISNGFVIYSVIPSAGGCPGTPITVRVDVKPIPVITTPSSSLSPQICSNQALNFTPASTISGTTYTWTSTVSGPISAPSITASGNGVISDTPINTGNISGIVTYHITPHFNGCDGVPVDYVVTVKPLPSAAASNVIICSGQNAVISILPTPKSVSGTTFAWTANPSVNVSGAVDGSGSLINQTLTTTNSLVGNVTYFITPTASGCSIAPVSVTATVNPIATVDAGVDYNVCEPSTIVVTGTIGGSATSGTWTKASGQLGALSASTTTTVSGTTTVTATYTVDPSDVSTTLKFTLTTNDPDGAGVSGPCTVAFDDVNIEVHKKAIVNPLSDYTVCEPAQITLSGTLGGSATSGSWTLVSSAAGTLAVSSVTGNNVTAAYYPGSADVTNTVSFKLTSNDPDGSGQCTSDSKIINIKINKSAAVNAGSDFEVCEDKVVQLNGSYSGATSAVTWTGGSGASQFSDIHDPLATYTLTATDIAAGTVTLTLTTNDPDGSGASGPCNPVSDQVTFKINKLPQPQIVGLQPIYAENDPIATLVGFSSNSSGGIGVFTGPGIIAGTSQFDPAISGTGLITITFTFTDNKTCVGVTTANTIVNPVTSVDFDVADSAGTVIFKRDANGYPLVCANQGNVELVGTPRHDDSKHQLPTGFTAVTLDPSRLNNVANKWLIDTKGLLAGNYSIKYTYTNEFGATNSIIKDIVVLSAPLAVIDVGNNCIDNAVQFTESSYVPNNLSGGTIVNWNWLYGEDLNGSNGAIKEPFYSYSNAGVHNVQLKVTTDQGCSNSASKNIIIGVKPNPDFTWSSFCQGDTTKFINKSTSTFGVIDKYGWDFRDGDTLGISSATKAIPPGKHAGRTLGVWSDPKHTFQNFKAYRVKLWVGTNAGCIDTLSKRVVILDFTAPLPTSAYFNNFENGPGTWFAVSNTANDTLVSWTLETPTGDRINSANSGVNAWWTGKNKNTVDRSSYYENENSYVVGPCLDLTALERPMISLDYWADTQIGFDGAVVQYSLDGGATWETVGDAQGAGINWYNQRDLLSQPGDQDNFAWSDSLTNWINARYNLDKIPQADRDKVVLRLAFASNNDNPNGRILNGFAFDNIYVGEKKRTVVVEHFVNNADLSDSKKIDQLFDDQTILPPKKGKSDFFKIEYHLDVPNNSDTVNMVNPYDSRVRALYYGVSQPPYSIMDGITGSYFDANFNGDLTYFTREEFDRRALEDPLFDIQINPAGSTIDHLKASIDITYLDSLKTLDNSVVVYAALVEGSMGTLHNVVKKLLPTNGGFILKGPWDTSRPKETVNIDYSIDVHITNPDSLYLVAFVQNNSFDTNSGMSRMIHQATKIKLNKMVSPVVTGLPENPSQVEIHGIKIYPNPAKNTLFFGSDVKLDKSYTWELVDQRGVSVLNGQLAQDLRVSQQVDVSSLANGIYFVKIGTTKGSVIYKKIAIVNGF